MSSPPSYRSGVPSSMRSGSLADSGSRRTASAAPSYKSAPLPPLPAPPPPPPSLITAPEYEVYYRLYTPSGAIPVKEAASRPDPFVGRILARSVPPPHLAGVLKRRILAAEGLLDLMISVEESPNAQLVPSPSQSSPTTSRISLSGSPRLSRLLVRSTSVLNGKLLRPPSSNASHNRSSMYSLSSTTSRDTNNRNPYNYNSYPSITSISSSTPAPTTNGTQIYASIYDSELMRDDAWVVLTGDGRHGASPDNPLAVVFLEELTGEARKARPQAEDYASREIPLDKYIYYRLYNRDGEVRSSVAFDSVHTALGRIERAHVTPHATVDSLRSCIAKVERQRIWKYADLYQGTAPRDALWGGTSIGRQMGGDVNSPLMMVQPERKSGLFNRPARMLTLKTRRHRNNEKLPLIYDIPEGTVMQTDGVVLKDSLCECIVPGLAERAMLKRKWFELLDE
ncbi:hypothetical protein FB45DRAFT_210140 [Roridomyces roridus]|uniref:Uncharacterized protein n=1 Tax=Roridomyces roridus TaxID=1738132 RepID=A0AAD7CGC6_9AGAR|nr:hypothetical protein FB45DRAFT_210140 [Roridomyces roridus]